MHIYTIYIYIYVYAIHIYIYIVCRPFVLDEVACHHLRRSGQEENETAPNRSKIRGLGQVSPSASNLKKTHKSDATLVRSHMWVCTPSNSTVLGAADGVSHAGTSVGT